MMEVLIRFCCFFPWGFQKEQKNHKKLIIWHQKSHGFMTSQLATGWAQDTEEHPPAVELTEEEKKCCFKKPGHRERRKKRRRKE